MEPYELSKGAEKDLRKVSRSTLDSLLEELDELEE